MVAQTTTIARKLDAGIESGLLRNLHAVSVWRDGETVLECYYAGPDSTIMQDFGHVEFGPDTLHDLRSVTKSIVGILYGIALDQNLVPPPEASLFAQFPDYPDLGADPQLEQITIHHALTMTLGMEWDESLPYTDPRNAEIAMEDAADRYGYVLSRPLVEPPGAKWIYSGGAVALVGAIIERGTGQTLTQFAAANLFEPLGIRQHGWFAGRDGVYSAAAGLRLTTPDLLRIGAMLVSGGIWNGRRVVSEGWITRSWLPATEVPWGERYGYLWYSGTTPALGADQRFIAGYGNGGQRLVLLPEHRIACVVFCGAYDTPDQAATPTRVWREIVFPSL